MYEKIAVHCQNTGSTFEVEAGTPLHVLAARIPQDVRPYPAATVNNRIKELDYRIYKPVTVRFITADSFQGVRVLQRTAWFVLQKSVRDLWPGLTLHIRHSLGRNGFYCETDGHTPFTAAECDALAARMRELIAADRPIGRCKLPTDEVRSRFEALGYQDKIDLLETRPRLYSTIYTLDNSVGYFYGALAPSTRYMGDDFSIEPCYDGFLLRLWCRHTPAVRHEKMRDIFREYQSWVRMMGFPTVGAINRCIMRGDAGGMIKIAEAFHERKFASIADRILAANRERGVRMVLISGPSSSGKTTSAKRLSIQLGVLGLKPVLISLDDYFVDREKTPRDENGDYDYEALEAIDLGLFNDHLQRLMRGESVEIPRYDFITGRRTPGGPLTIDERSILVVEGIHGLNPRLTPGIDDALKFRIYISCFTSVAMDNLSRIATTDNRLLRRMIRDARTRGSDALATLSRWPSVRRGEEKHIFPYQENADVMLNSSLFYELSVLRPFAEPLLREIPDTVPEYDEARRLLRFLDSFVPMSPDGIPPTSVLREFIGGSSFKG